MHSHLHQNQNQCMEQPHRMLANGPNHPGPGPEEIPMGDVSVCLSVCLYILNKMCQCTGSTALLQMHQCLLNK